MDTFIFYPDAVLKGQWWRLVSFPFVHVSFYHLALDAGAFLMLLGCLKHHSPGERLVHVCLSGIFSLAFACLFSPEIDTLGLCGLSGTAHGLMAVTGLSMMKTERDRWMGLFCFALVASKSIGEVVTGHAFFSTLHAQACGVPLVACHLGGVVGGLVSFMAFLVIKIIHGKSTLHSPELRGMVPLPDCKRVDTVSIVSNSETGG